MFGLIDAQYYHIIYDLIVVFLSVIVFSQYRRKRAGLNTSSKESPSVYMVLLSAFMILFIGLRPVNGTYFVDMSSYNHRYLLFMGEPFSFDWGTDNIIFDNLFLLMASRNVAVDYFFLLIAALYFGCIAWACSLMFPQDKLATFLVYLGAFSTFSYGVNGIKAGAAAALFLVALALNMKEKKVWAVFFLLLSLGFHHSMILPVVAFIFCLFVRSPRAFIVFWIICFFIAAFHVVEIQYFFSNFVDEQGAGYLLGDEENVRHDILNGFRIDFILYSFAPILVGWIAVRRGIEMSRNYRFLFCLYTLTNAIWLLCMYAEFTNRIAYLSWFLLPIVLIYPFLIESRGKRQYQTFRWVAYVHLAFTLFMNYIYY